MRNGTYYCKGIVAVILMESEAVDGKKEGWRMVQPGILLVYLGSELDRPQFLLYDGAEKGAKALGMEICREVTCTKHDGRVGPHSHADGLLFGEAQGYPEEDVERAGLNFKECWRHNGEVKIVWHLWAEKSDPPAIYYAAADLIVPTKRGDE